MRHRLACPAGLATQQAQPGGQEGQVTHVLPQIAQARVQPNRLEHIPAQRAWASGQLLFDGALDGAGVLLCDTSCLAGWHECAPCTTIHKALAVGLGWAGLGCGSRREYAVGSGACC